MSGKVPDLPIRYKRAVFTQNKLDRINFRSGNGGRVLRNPPGVTRCWSRAWYHESLSHGIDKMADPVMLSIFGIQLLIFVHVVVIRREICDGFSATIWYRCKETAAFTQRDKSGRAVIRFTKALFTQRSLSDLTLDQSKVMSDKVCVNTLNRIGKPDR